MRSVGREIIGRSALAAGNASPCNGPANVDASRLFLDHRAGSESVNFAWMEHWTVIMRYMYRNMRLCILMLTGVIVSCTTIPEPYESPPEGTDSVAVFYSRWVAYLDRVNPGALQNDCRPRLVEPVGQVPYRGTVVLVHGFMACPQQFFELSELLALQGFRSILVLLPGHGRQFTDPAGDDMRGVPTDRNWQKKFDVLAAEVNGIMEFADGVRVIGGHSVGGAASLYIHSRAVGLYDRNILFAPFFASSQENSSVISGSESASIPGEPPANISSFGLKQVCLERREEGRAGNCDYQKKYFTAINAIGDSILKSVRESPLAAPVQLVGVEKDTVASNDKMHDFLNSQNNAGQTSACFFAEGVPHEMLSQYDFPGVEMYWLDSLLSGSIGYITAGQQLPTIGKVSVSEMHYAICATETERRD